MTAVGPASGQLDTRGDRSGGRDDGSEAGSPGAYSETNQVILVFAEIAAALADREREARATLTVVRGDGGTT